jgi:hypothetical protein
MANTNGWGDGAANNTIGWGQGANNTIGWGDIHADSWAGLTDITGVPGFDPDAQVFFTATGITDATQKSAVNQLVLDLKSYGIWTLPSIVIYPMVGGTNSSTSYNLINPSLFQITWAGGVTSSSNGVSFNGINSYGNTGYNPSTQGTLNSSHLSYYSRTNSNGTEVEIGAMQPGGNYNMLEIRTTGTTYFLINQSGLTTVLDANSQGYYIGNRQASNDIDGWKSGTKLINATTASTQIPNANLFIGAMFNASSGLASNFTNKQCAFASIGSGLTDTEATNFTTAVQAFQVALARNV